MSVMAVTPKLAVAVNAKENTVEAVAKLLPDTDVVFDLVEALHGGGA